MESVQSTKGSRSFLISASMDSMEKENTMVSNIEAKSANVIGQDGVFWVVNPAHKTKALMISSTLCHQLGANLSIC
jgi:hypothetical protein